MTANVNDQLDELLASFDSPNVSTSSPASVKRESQGIKFFHYTIFCLTLYKHSMISISWTISLLRWKKKRKPNLPSLEVLQRP